ncbi:MAG: hypothetical protein IPP86_04245 [Bacteroidetes bacterium]|nr:hypothetical protein [Bacteroidota bacterium]
MQHIIPFSSKEVPVWDAEGTTQPNEMVLITHNLHELRDVLSNYVKRCEIESAIGDALDHLKIIYGETEAV